MEVFAQVLGLFCIVGALLTGLFLFLAQPIWSIVDIAVSKKLPGAAKALLIVFTLIALGPLLTFFYGLFSETKALRRSTAFAGAMFVLFCGAMLGLGAVAGQFSPLDSLQQAEQVFGESENDVEATASVPIE